MTPNICQTSSLADLAIIQLLNYIINAIGRKIPINEIKIYVNKLGRTSPNYQNLLHLALESNAIDSNIKLECIRILLNSMVFQLNWSNGTDTPSLCVPILKVIAEQGIGLTSLDVSLLHWTHEDINCMLKVEFKCINLIEISLNTLHVNLFNHLKNHCTNLTKLKIKFINKYDIDSICSYAYRDNITEINGWNYYTFKEIDMLIRNLPNLEFIYNIHPYTGKSLFLASSNTSAKNNSNNFETKLKYISDACTTDECIDVIIKMCPQLEAIYLLEPRFTLKKLNQLNLCYLEIYSNSLITDNLNMFGTNLQYLSIRGGASTEKKLDFEQIVQYFPKLIGIQWVGLTTVNYSGNAKFENLQIIYAESHNDACAIFKSFQDNSCVFNALTLTELIIEYYFMTLSDANILTIFTVNKFLNLKHVSFMFAHFLSIESVKTIIQHCPALQSIGPLDKWNINSDEILLLRKYIKEHNICVRIYVNQTEVPKRNFVRHHTRFRWNCNYA